MDFARARLVTLRLKGGEKKRKEIRRVSSSRIGFTEILFLSNSRAAEFLHSEAVEGRPRDRIALVAWKTRCYRCVVCSGDTEARFVQYAGLDTACTRRSLYNTARVCKTSVRTAPLLRHYRSTSVKTRR